MIDNVEYWNLWQAELANRSLVDFMDILKKIDIPWCEYSEDMKNTDDLAVKLMLQESEK